MSQSIETSSSLRLEDRNRNSQQNSDESHLTSSVNSINSGRDGAKSVESFCEYVRNNKWCISIGSCFLLWIVLPSISIGLIISILIKKDETTYDTEGFIADIMMIITHFFTFIVINIIVFSDNGDPSNREEHHSVISLTFLLILGYGDSLFNLTRFGDQLFVIFNRNYPSGNTCERNIGTSVAENACKFISQLCILTFIINKDKYEETLKTMRCRIIIGCLSFSCFIQWFLLLFQEIDQENRKHDSCILNSSHIINSFEKIEPYLYPLGLEFRIACFIELLVISKLTMSPCLMSMFRRIPNCVVRVFSCIKFCVTWIVSNMVCHCMESCCMTNRCRKLFLLILLPTSGILLVSISTTIIFFQDFNEHNNIDLVIVISECCEILLVFVTLLHSIRTNSKLKMNEIAGVDARLLPNNLIIEFFFFVFRKFVFVCLLWSCFVWLHYIFTNS